MIQRFSAPVLAAALLLVPAAAMAQEKVKKVDAKFVCFINKKHFSRAQEAVKVEGKTYYACCQDCVTRLNQDPVSRMDKDPVSGKELDKAEAVVGVDQAGNAYFFENIANLNKFRTAKKP